MNLEVLARINLLEQQVADLKQTIATNNTYGLSKVTSATDVTEDSTGIAMSATQNNASVAGSLRSEINQTKRNLEKIVFGSVVVTIGSDTFEISAPGIASETAFAINGDTNTVDQVRVVSVKTLIDKIVVRLSGVPNQAIRINYLYKRS